MANKDDDNIIYEDGCPDWMMTMGDCMSLLLCFFVLLLTFSTKGDDQLMNVLGFVQGAMGAVAQPEVTEAALERPANLEGVAGVTSKGSLVHADDLSPVQLKGQEIRNRFADMLDGLRAAGFTHYVTIDQLDQGVAITVDTQALFDGETNTLLPKAYVVLELFANNANNVANEIRINATLVGRTQLAKDWGQAIERALVIGRELEARYDFEPSRFGFGVGVANDGNDRIVFMLVEQLAVQEVTWDEFINLVQKKGR